MRDEVIVVAEMPTIVLVHGAFADGASWSPVALRLQGAGFGVRVPAISNRSLAADADYVSAFVSRIAGPVVLVGHSYGATVVGVAGRGENVAAVVFVSGYVLDEGESAAEIHARFPAAPAVEFFREVAYPELGDGTRRDISVDEREFAFLAAAGVPDDEAEVLAVTQRPLDAAVLSEPAQAAAWRTRPAWGVVGLSDRVVNPDALRWAYERAGARQILELEGPHLLMHTHPAEVAALIVRVVASVS
jgi:pimeloyl-ACP methyl ester carboxylesterase